LAGLSLGAAGGGRGRWNGAAPASFIAAARKSSQTFQKSSTPVRGAFQFPSKNFNFCAGIWTYQGVTGNVGEKTIPRRPPPPSRISCSLPAGDVSKKDPPPRIKCARNPPRCPSARRVRFTPGRVKRRRTPAALRLRPNQKYQYHAFCFFARLCCPDRRARPREADARRERRFGNRSSGSNLTLRTRVQTPASFFSRAGQHPLHVARG
jgi:hypothetical protein